MRTLTDIQFWFAQVKVAYANQMEVLLEAKKNGEEIDPSLELRLQAAQTFILDVDWMIENTPTDLIGIVGEIYKVIAFVGTSLPDVQDFYNSQVGNTNIVVGNGVSIPLASNTIYGKVRLSVAPVLSSDPIAVGDNDPRLAAGQSGYDERIVSGSFSSAGVLTLTKGDASVVTVSGGVIMNQSASAQSGSIWINGIIKSAGMVVTGLTDPAAQAFVVVTDSSGILYKRTLAEFAADINIGTFTANRAIITNGSGALTSSATTATEVGYLSGVTSAIQSQINNRQPLDADLTAIAALTADGLLRKTAGVWGMDENNYITGNQNITLSGDVTGNGTTGIVTTIAADSVTFAKMQNINSAVILGRSSGGVGNIEQLTIGTGLALTTGVLSSTITQYTDAMARLAISSSATGLSYDNTTGVFSLTAGYIIPTTTEQTNWNAAYGNMIVSAGFNTSNGNLTLTQQDGGTIVQDLDGRYLLGNEAITLSGDVTGSGTTAIATTIASGAVTFAKFQNISSGVILGRSAAGSGSASEITIGSGLSLAAGVLSLGTLTANRAVVTNVSGVITAATTTATEIGYVSGVTSAIQTQIDNKQPLDATLTALAAFGTATPGIMVLSGADTFVTRILEGTTGRITINNASGSGTNPSIDIASTYAGQSSITTVGTITVGAWQGSSIADGYIVSAADWNEAYDEKINSLGFNTATGIFTGFQQDGGTVTASLDGRYLLLSGGTLTGPLALYADPVTNLQAATKQYVDNLATGIKPKGSVAAATTGTLPSYSGSTLTLVGTSNGALSAQDGVTLTLGQYLLVKNETGANEKYNGIYELTEVGDGSNPYELTRISTANTWGELVNATVYVAGGTTLQGYTFYQTAPSGGTLGTTSVTWVVFSISTVYLEGSGIDITGNTISVATGGIVDSMVSASASIALSKLASVTANKALVSDSSGYVSASAVTSTELGYVAGVTSAIQTQINNKQPLDATLTALAAFNSNGLMVQTAADTFTSRTIVGTTNRLDVTNGSGVGGNPTLDISSAYVGQASITTLGTIGVGTWQGTAIADTYIASSGNWNSAYNNMIVSAAFNTGDGVLTLTQQDTGTVTVDLDGRYVPSSDISGTSGYLPLFGASNTLGNSIVSQSGTDVRIIGVGSALVFDTLGLASSSIIKTVEDYKLSIKNTRGGQTEIKVGNEDLEFLTNTILRMKILQGGQIITASATNTGEHFIVGGSARVNGTTQIQTSAGYNAYFQTSGTSVRINYLNDAFSANVSASYRALDYTWQDNGGSAIMSLSATQLITFGASNTGEAHIFGGTSRFNGTTKIEGGNFNIGASLGSDRRFTLRGQGATSSTYAAEFANGSGSTILLLRDDGISFFGDRIIIGSFTDNGVDKLQVNGSGYFAGNLKAYNGSGRALTLQKNSAFTGNYYIDYLNSAGTSIAYLGFGSGGNDKFQIYNTLAETDIYAGTSKFSLGFNGGDSTINTKLFAPTLNLSSLPTSASGLSAGDLWNNGNVVMIGNSAVATFSSDVTIGGLLTLNLANTGVNAYHTLNRNTITTENMFKWTTNGVGKWWLGQRSKNSEDGFSFYSGAIGDDILYFNPAGNSVFYGSVTATSFIKSGGTSAQFLKADGSVDSNSYLTTGSAVLNQSIGTPQTASFDVANDSRVAGRFYIGSNGCYIQEVLIGSTYELRAFDSAGNSTILT